MLRDGVGKLRIGSLPLRGVSLSSPARFQHLDDKVAHIKVFGKVPTLLHQEVIYFDPVEENLIVAEDVMLLEVLVKEEVFVEQVVEKFWFEQTAAWEELVITLEELEEVIEVAQVGFVELWTGAQTEVEFA